MPERNAHTKAAFAPLQKIASTDFTVSKVDGRPKVVFGKGMDRASKKRMDSLTNSFHRAKIAALEKAVR